MNQKPKISIVTIVYNGEMHLEKAIKSVLEQKYDPIEYIIVDGGSRDGTLGIIRKYEHQLAHWTSEPDSGISEAFNKGLAACTGDIIGFLNADDWYEDDALKVVALEFNNADILYGNLRTWNNGYRDYIISARHDLLTREMSVNHPAVFVKREVYQNLGGFKPEFRIAMDYEFLLRCLVSGKKFRYVDQVMTNMKSEGHSQIHWHQGCIEVVRAKDLHLGRKWQHRLWFIKQTAMIRLGFGLQRVGMGKLANWYRRYSPVTKSNTDHG